MLVVSSFCSVGALSNETLKKQTKNSLWPIKISIIEDDDWIRENLAGQIKQTKGFCLRRLLSQRRRSAAQIPKAMPDVVLMDINLPKMSGIECVRKLKSMIPVDARPDAHGL